MTFRATESDLEAQVKRLNRNTGLNGNDEKDYHIIHANGYINLMKNRGSKDISLGNTKTELYWQIVMTNKILEEIEQ